MGIIPPMLARSSSPQEAPPQYRLGQLSHNLQAHQSGPQPWFPGQTLPPREVKIGGFRCGTIAQIFHRPQEIKG